MQVTPREELQFRTQEGAPATAALTIRNLSPDNLLFKVL